MNWQRRAFDAAILTIQREADRGFIGQLEAAEAARQMRIIRPQTESDRAYGAFFNGRVTTLSWYPNGQIAAKIRYDSELDLLGLTLYNRMGVGVCTSYSLSEVESIEAFAARVYMLCLEKRLPLDVFRVVTSPIPSRQLANRANTSVRWIDGEPAQVIVYDPSDRAVQWWLDHGVKIVWDDDETTNMERT